MQVKSEILNLLDNTNDQTKLQQAERTAISQMRKWLGKRYDLDTLFAPWNGTGDDTRDPYIVMTVIDIALYHLWSARAAGNKIPAWREQRYNDALDWLKKESKGEGPGSDMPEKPMNIYTSDFRIVGRKPENHKW